LILLTLVLVGDLLEEVVEVRPLEEPVEEPQEFSLVQHLEAAHRRLQVQVQGSRLALQSREGESRVGQRRDSENFSALSAGAYTTIWLGMVT
jgi:hypothetical protein